MIVAVSGYNASGKTTLTKRLIAALQEQQLPCAAAKLDKLYLSKRFSRKQERAARPQADGRLSLRRLEGQRGEWNRPFGFRQFVDVVWAAMLVRVLKALSARRVLVFDRYFHDRLVHFDSTGLLYRLASWLLPSPHLLFVLLPDRVTWERRILDRIERRFGVSVDALSEADRAELDFVRGRYESVLRPDGATVRIDSGQPDACDEAVGRLLALVPHLVQSRCAAANH